MNPKDNNSGESGLTNKQPENAGAVSAENASAASAENAGAASAENAGAPKEDQGKPGAGDSGEANQAKPKETGKQPCAGATVGGPKSKQQEKKNTAREKAILDIMDANKASELWENKSGEFFTSENLALLSVKGEKAHVKKHSRELIEAWIDNA